jgi:hypothetical protein
MINYKSPERQRLVDNIVVAINKRNVAGMNLPWSCISYWIACSKVEKADAELIRHDRKELLNEMSRARKECYTLPVELQVGSPERDVYNDAIESYHEHVDAYGEVV